MSRSRSIYSNMLVRFKKLAHIDSLPFELGHLRTLLVQSLGQPCKYCTAKLTTTNMSVDHRNPFSRGGGLEFDNLDVICKSCNTIKGEMRSEEYLDLLSVLNSFEPSVASDITGRLKAGAAVKRLRFLGKK